MNLIIGTRGSKLALWQANFVKFNVLNHFPEIEINLQVIKTTGDRNLSSELPKIGGRGVFVKEIEEALLDHKIDLAVHSFKDIPSEITEDLKIGAVIKRGNPFDAFVSKNNVMIDDLNPGSKVATGSLRRKSQLLCNYSHIEIVPIRGNVDTRIKKLDTEGLDGVVLAAAGLERLNYSDLITQIFSLEQMVPAPCQGIIAVQTREGEEELDVISNAINDIETEHAGTLERSFQKEIGGDCNIPLGCYAEIKDNLLYATGLLADDVGKRVIRKEISGLLSEGAELGIELARKILEDGGNDIIKELKEK